MSDIPDSGRILNDVAYAATTAINSDVLIGNSHARKTSFYIYATTAGTAMPQYRDSKGRHRDMVASAVAVAANTLLVLDFGFYIPASRIVFTPSSQPGTIHIEAASYPFGM